MNGDDEYGAGPYQLSLIDKLRDTPTLSTPTQGTPRPGTSQTTRQRAFEEMEKVRQLMEQRPDVGEIERVGRAKYEAAGEDIAPAILLQALGGKLAPWGGQVLQRSMAARGPQKVTGGELVGGQFVEDPYHAQQRKIQGGQVLARTLESAAEHEETAAERERSHRASEQAKADAERRHQEQQKEARAGRYASQSLAERRFAYEQSRGEEGAVQVVTDPITGQSALVNKRTGETRPVSVTGESQAVPAVPRDERRVSKPTEGGLAAEGYLGRMKAAETIMDRPNLAQAQKPGFFEQAVGTKSQVGANLLRSTERQQVHQAQKDWVRAKLRKESGAVIGEEEMAEEIRTYFPQINDGPAVIEQKRQARIEAQNQMRTMAGLAPRPAELPPGALPDVSRGTPVGADVSREPTKTIPRSPTEPGGAGWSIVR